MQREQFRIFLQNQLAARFQRNSSYSIRAFARDLHIDNSTLTKLLSGERTLSAKRIVDLGQKLGLTGTEIERFLGEKEKKKDVQLSVDQFHLVSDWYHDAIIELAKYRKTFSHSELAKKLGITVSQVKLALERLQRLGFIRLDENGMYHCELESSLLNFDEESFTNDALKTYQDQLLELSRAALQKTSKEKRNHTSYVISMPEDIVPEVNQRIREFQKELASYIAAKQGKNSVYAIQFSSFPLTRESDHVYEKEVSHEA